MSTNVSSISSSAEAGPETATPMSYAGYFHTPLPPLFVSGYPKSGTTLLLSLLDGHPQLIVIPEELHFFRNVLFAQNARRGVRVATGLKRFLPAEPGERGNWSQGKPQFLGGYPEFDDHKFSDLLDRALQQHRGGKDLLLRLVDAFVEADGSTTDGHKWCVTKTPNEEIYFPLMRRMFGADFMFLYIVRDPRDVYLSTRQRRAILGWRSKSAFNESARMVHFAADWGTRVRVAQRLQASQANFHVVRYEDLVLDTQAACARLGQWLRIENSTALHTPTRHGKPWGGNSVFADEFGGISAEACGRYQRLLDEPTWSGLEWLLHKEMAELGYAANSAGPRLGWRRRAALSARLRLQLVNFGFLYKRRQAYMAARYWLETHRRAR